MMVFHLFDLYKISLGVKKCLNNKLLNDKIMAKVSNKNSSKKIITTFIILSKYVLYLR